MRARAEARRRRDAETQRRRGEAEIKIKIKREAWRRGLAADLADGDLVFGVDIEAHEDYFGLSDR